MDKPRHVTRRTFVERATLACALTGPWGAWAAGSATATGTARELIRDPRFSRGFFLLAPKPGSRVVAGVLRDRPTGPEPVWDLAQWSTRFPFALAAPEHPAAGVTQWANEGQSVTLGPDAPDGSDLALGVKGVREYAGRARKLGEPWVHLLVQQEFNDPPALAEVAGVRLRLEARLLESKLERTPDHTPDLHAAQFQIFVTLQNRRRDSGGFGRLVWFGIPLYDDRTRFPREHKQRDTGGTDMFIFTPGGETYTDRSAHDRTWIAIDRELRPLFLEALETAWSRGFLTESRSLSDYRITGMNLGWEVPGLLDVAMQVRGLSLRVR